MFRHGDHGDFDAAVHSLDCTCYSTFNRMSEKNVYWFNKYLMCRHLYDAINEFLLESGFLTGDSDIREELSTVYWDVKKYINGQNRNNLPAQMADDCFNYLVLGVFEYLHGLEAAGYNNDSGRRFQMTTNRIQTKL